MRGKEQTKGVPIIFLTAGAADKQRRFRGYEAGAVDFLQKPIETDIMVSKAGIFFELYRRRQELARQRDELKIATQESRKYAAALKEADQRKDEFLATLAHELRNPLAPIRSGLEILRREPTGEAADRVKDMMDRQLSHMVRLFDDLLDMSRVSKGKIDLRKEKLDLQTVIQSALESVQPYIDEAGHELVLDVTDEPIWVDADHTRLGQIISNLLNNAAKYTADGGKIILSISEKNGDAIIAVSDNGVGIPSDMLTKIFDLFTQVNSSMDHSHGGLGIGLALVKHLVGMHGGTIQVESPGANQGSIFTVRLPVTTPPSEMKPGEAMNEKQENKTLNILVVDDNVDSAQTTGWMLETIGHNYILAHDGVRALEIAQESRPDVILLDIGLPGMNGYDVCRTLRKNPLFESTLIIAQTGWGQKRDREMAREAGFSHHLVKPLRLEDINSLLA
jgi:signal transduction histidine kinase